MMVLTHREGEGEGEGDNECGKDDRLSKVNRCFHFGKYMQTAHFISIQPLSQHTRQKCCLQNLLSEGGLSEHRRLCATLAATLWAVCAR